tara:strand:+ start:178 stop:408 length:231 start_codon:yes stop_codon:yes gene_type:complete
MLETLIPVGVALATGFGVLMSKLHMRVHELDRRVDGVELRIAENYLSKIEFSNALERVEAHMVRIENKLDTIATKQ